MYLVQTTPVDITPRILVNFNKTVAQMFLELDDLAVGLVDMLNPTYIPEGFLPVIANFFNIQLRSSHPAAWRNQIKHAMPLFKKKGTAEGLKTALDKAGIRLLKLTNLWQVVSPYTWTDGFLIEKDIQSSDIIGFLSKKPITNTELEITIKSSETKEYFLLPNNIIHLQEILVPEHRIAVMWNGSSQNPAIELFKGDIIKVNYKYNKIPETSQSLENYIKTLPLADQRDEVKVRYPVKNWNVKLIEEDDPLFDLLISERHPFQNTVTYGKIRTTFLYSEKAFNMDTYNGSLYNSNNPCDMDKNFLDSCSNGQSSKFNVHLEFEQIDDDKVTEAKEIITDFSPFHAVLHKVKINSNVSDFVVPVEKIKNEIKNKNTKSGDDVGCSEAIYCQIKYKNGKIENGRLV
jgi:phage tail P2-like protein